jgi:flavin-dependent dehydrogenase
MEAGLNEHAPVAATLTIREAGERRWDAVVVGAGPAGALAARTLALAGRSVLLVDKARFPRAKVCGCCLSAAALDVLERVGLGGLVRPMGAVRLERFWLHAGSTRAELPIRGVSLSRERLDAGLIREGVRAGAAFLPEAVAEVSAQGTWLRGVGPRGDRATAETVVVAADVTLVSDGLAGTACELEPPVIERGGRIGVAAVVESAFEPGVIQMVYGRGGYVGMVRLEDGRTNVAAALDPGFVRERGGPGAAMAGLFAQAGAATPAGLAHARWSGTPRLTRYRRRVWRPGVLVIGDAAGYVEPFTGEGMGWAMAAGAAAAGLAAEGRLEDWPAEYARLIARRQRLCRAAAWVLRRPRLTRAAVRIAASAPGLARGPVGRVQRPLLGGIP